MAVNVSGCITMTVRPPAEVYAAGGRTYFSCFSTAVCPFCKSCPFALQYVAYWRPKG